MAYHQLRNNPKVSQKVDKSNLDTRCEPLAILGIVYLRSSNVLLDNL